MDDSDSRLPNATPSTIVTMVWIPFDVDNRRIFVSVSSPFVIACLILATCAVTSSTKLPLPFKTLTIYILYLDIIVVILGLLECWIGHLIHYLQEFEDMSIFLMLSTVAMLCMERAFALKCPLRYLTFCGKERLVKAWPCVTWLIVFALFLTFRVFVCYFMEWSLERRSCFSQRRYFAIGTVVSLNMVASLCFLTVVHCISQNKVSHTRRITRMGLPQRHASGAATDTHISAILFVLFPPMFGATLGFIFTEYWHGEVFERIISSYSVCVSMSICLYHGLIYCLWFDESRLYVMTVLSPIDGRIRTRADAMRIEIYNIVLAQAFEMEGAGGGASAAASGVTSVGVAGGSNKRASVISGVQGEAKTSPSGSGTLTLPG